MIFIMADDLGWGDLGCYGQERIKTPQLDAMAAQGMRMTQFYAGSTVCAPSRCVLMTGLHTGHCLVRGNGRLALRPGDVTVAELMKGRGYTTSLIGKWGLGEEGTTGVPTRQGFDSFFGYLNQRHAHNYWTTFLLRDEQRVALRNTAIKPSKDGSGVAEKRLDYSHDLFAAEALKFLDQHRTEPFFLYLALTIPHANNEARNKGMEVPDHGQYADLDWPEPQKGQAAMISRMDRDVGRILDRLRKLGIAKNTLVIFTSDNGPHREGGNRPNFANSNGPLRGIKRDLYEGGIRVPTIAWWPGKIVAGSTSKHLAYFGDLFATAADLAGSEAPERLDSISFLPTLTGEGQQEEHASLYWEFYEGGSSQAVRTKRWKAVRKPMFTGKTQLFEIGKDIGEKSNVAEEHPKVVAEMERIMTASHTPSDRWKVRKRKRRK
ncbi:MAG: arylsulfatase [Planctomycetota bacterium]|nr:arylsulfatase [Planctomycetota bacterium]